MPSDRRAILKPTPPAKPTTAVSPIGADRRLTPEPSLISPQAHRFPARAVGAGVTVIGANVASGPTVGPLVASMGNAVAVAMGVSSAVIVAVTSRPAAVGLGGGAMDVAVGVTVGGGAMDVAVGVTVGGGAVDVGVGVIVGVAAMGGMVAPDVAVAVLGIRVAPGVAVAVLAIVTVSTPVAVVVSVGTGIATTERLGLTSGAA